MVLRHWFQEWKKDIYEHTFKISLAILFLILSFAFTIFSSNYVDGVAAISVPDLILDSIPTVDLSFLFVWGILLVVVVYIAYPLFFQPRRFHYALGLLALFLLVRSGFIVLTHLKAPIGAIPVAQQGFMQIVTYSNDLFFSGHAGLPFLGFLVFYRTKIRYFMLASSIILACTVLLMHVHYSIDVASAYFITYGVYVLGDAIFSDASTEKARTA